MPEASSRVDTSKPSSNALLRVLLAILVVGVLAYVITPTTLGYWAKLDLGHWTMRRLPLWRDLYATGWEMNGTYEAKKPRVPFRIEE